MKELYTTYNLCIQYKACERALTLWVDYTHGDFDADAPIPMIKVVDVFGVSDCLWALRTIENQVAAKKIMYDFSVFCAKRIISIFSNESTDYQKELVATARAFLSKIENKNVEVTSAIAYGSSQVIPYELSNIKEYGDDYIYEHEWYVGKLKGLIMEAQNE